MRDRSLGGKEVGDSRQAVSPCQILSLLTGYGQASNSSGSWQLAACQLLSRLY